MSSSSSLPQKRPAAEAPDAPSASGPTNDRAGAAVGGESANGGGTRYARLLSIVTKCLAQSRERIASDAPATIRDAYGEMASLFTSDDEDGDGVSSLVDLLLGKLDGVHDRLTAEKLPGSGRTRLEQLLEENDVKDLLTRVERSIAGVEEEERLFNEAEEADKSSAREAIRAARSTRVSPGGKRRRVLPSESIGYHAHRMKAEYHDGLKRELEEVSAENERLESELKSRWDEFQGKLDALRESLGTLEDLGKGAAVDGGK